MKSQIRPILNLGVISLVFLIGNSAFATPRDIAFRLHQRIAGLPPSEATLATMEAQVAAGQFDQAAYTALSHPGFTDVTLRTFFSTWFNREETPDVPLNDAIATAVGIVRDGVDFRQMLYGDIVYHIDQSLWFQNVANDNAAPAGTRLVRQPRATTDSHFNDIESKGFTMSNAQEFIRAQQSLYTNSSLTVEGVTRPYGENIRERLDASITAGVQTLRGFGGAFYSAGTNRRPFAFIVKNFLLAGVGGMENLHDTSLPDNRIRRDVDRAPSASSIVFLNKCLGCHALMDPMTGAYAHINFGNSILYAERNAQGVLNVENKMVQNGNVFPSGHVTIDDSWVNYMPQGINAKLGFRQPPSGQSVVSGRGYKSMGEVLANTRAYSESIATRVFNRICFRGPSEREEQAFANMVTNFENTGYDVRRLFVESAGFCLASLE